MLALILQFMGFRADKPVHSRAEDKYRGTPSIALDARLTADDAGLTAPVQRGFHSDKHAQAIPARSQEVNVMPGKTKQPTKSPSKVQPKAPKVAAKSGPVKPAAKSATKVALNPAAKSGPKPAARPVVKHEPSKKPAPSGAAKAAAKPVSKQESKPAGGKTGAIGKTLASHKIEANAAVKPQPVPEARPIPVSVAAASSPAVAQRAGRPSSRLASLTVPSMAQSVASTAAKASYSQVASLPLIVPPLPSATKKDPKLANNWKSKPVDQLTDPELLAMPDSEYMNEKQMAAFRLKLTILKQDILNSAGETTEHLREDTVVVPDPADRATIEEEHALELRTRDRERKLLKKIEQSISRIDAGDYGFCDETGEPIGVGRLLARPTATLSLEAQQRRELKQKMFGD